MNTLKMDLPLKVVSEVMRLWMIWLMTSSLKSLQHSSSERMVSRKLMAAYWVMVCRMLWLGLRVRVRLW